MVEGDVKRGNGARRGAASISGVDSGERGVAGRAEPPMRLLGELESRSGWLGSRCGVLEGRAGCGAGARRMVGDELGRDELGGVASGREVGGELGRVEGVPALGGGLDGRDGVADGRLGAGAGVLGREGGLTLGRDEPPPWGAEGRELPPL